MPHSDHPILVLTGPTASGKSAVGLSLAHFTHGEILSADSRQIYRPLTLGTAKPAPEELGRVPHHFINELELHQPFSAGRFAEAAWARIASMKTRGAIPIVVGGSTLYVQALVQGLAHIPLVPSEIRAMLSQRLATEGAEALFNELEQVDPEAAATMDAAKTQRLVRALEVFHGTGKPLSAYRGNQSPPPYAFRVVVLAPDRTRLYDRINKRVDTMLAVGLLDEVRGLLDAGYDPEMNPLRTIGYQEPIAYLQGRVSYEEMVRLLKRNTRRYAKRQLTFFKRFDEWLDPEAFQDTEAIAAHLLSE